MDRLPFQKPERHVDPDGLRAYAREHPSCEILECRRRPCPEAHHLVPRSRGRDDRPSNLLRLCPTHHDEFHALGGHEWFRRYQDRLLDGARQKVAAALRIEDAA